MTLASKITLFRLCLVPFFAIFAIYYAQSYEDGVPHPPFRWLALGCFVLASALDGLDGYIARRFNQKSTFGAILDPLTDKALLLTALITLSVVEWGEGWTLPIWFCGLVIARDILILGGIAILFYLNQHVPIRPHWTGKVCTVSQMVAIGWVMLQLIPLSPLYPTIVAAIFTVWSGYAYFKMGLSLLHPSQHDPQ